MKAFFPFLFLAVFALACENDDEESTPPVVVIAGLDGDATVLWNNGFPKVDPLQPAIFLCAFIGDKDLYYGGVTMGEYPPLPAYLHGGALTVINDSETGSIKAMFIAGADVYAAGNCGYTSGPCYWKNGEEVLLSGEFFGGAVGIFVKESDVYVVGRDKSPVYWKNGERVVLPAPGVNFETQAIAVDGNDIHVAGTSEWADEGLGLGLYWKNGQQKPLAFSQGAYTSWFTSMLIDEGNIYITGYQRVVVNGIEYVYATYWKNGYPVVLETEGWSLCTGLTVVKGSVHAIGSASTTGLHFPVYWNEGTTTILPHNADVSGEAYYISSWDQ